MVRWCPTALLSVAESAYGLGVNSRLSASIELILSALILVGYLLLAPARSALAPTFVPLAWVPYVLMLATFAYLDRHQWAALRLARMVLLERHRKIDHDTAQNIQSVIIPNRVAPFMPLYQILFVTAFAVLLFYQGWLTAIIAFALALLWGFVNAVFSAVLPATSDRADRRCLEAVVCCLGRRTLPQPGEATISDISRLELLIAANQALEQSAAFQEQYLASLRWAQQPS